MRCRTETHAVFLSYYIPAAVEAKKTGEIGTSMKANYLLHYTTLPKFPSSLFFWTEEYEVFEAVENNVPSLSLSLSPIMCL